MNKFLMSAMMLTLSVPSALFANQEVAPFSMAKAVTELRGFNTEAKGHMVRCADATKTILADKYLYTTDEKGNACHIYDMSFPNIKALLSGQGTQVPVQKMTGADYVNWLDGNYTAVDQSIKSYQANFNPRLAGNQSWVAKLKFKRAPEYVEGSKVTAQDAGLPRSFRLSDLELGTNFQFDAQTRVEIQKLLSELNGTESITGDFLAKVMMEPETLLKTVKFDWNDLKKVYDVILEGEFIPSKPVALVEYQAQYKYAVEKEFRGILVSGLLKLTSFIPEPTVQAVVNVFVVDAFEQLDLAYKYQMMQLEDTLRNSDWTGSERAMNVLYGQKTDLLQAYLTALVQNKPFDWNGLEKKGSAARYLDEKARSMTMSKTNSRLVLDKHCKMEFLHDYFGVCTKPNQDKEIYSLMSDRKAFDRSWGAPLIFSYKSPSQMVMRRGLAWILSMGLRIFGPQYLAPNDIQELNTALKDYLKTGILDEALLRNDLYKKGDTSDLARMLYIQNLNPFLPKSADSENNMILANKKLLGVQ